MLGIANNHPGLVLNLARVILASKLTELPLLVMRLMETFHVAVIASLLRVCCKIFVWAVLSPLDPAAVILIGDKSDDSVEGQ